MTSRPAKRALVAMVCVATLLLACGREALPSPVPFDAGASGGGVPTDGGVVGGSDDAGADASSSDAATPAPVRLGLAPNPLHSGPGAPTSGELLLARLSTFAAGVRMAVVPVAWASPAGTGLAPLTEQVAACRQHGVAVVLQLQVVVRHAAPRPAEVAELSWDDPVTVALLDETIDAALAAAGEGVVAVVLGDDVDAYLADHPEEATALGALLTHESEHLGPTGLGTAVGLSFPGAGSPAAYEALAMLGTLAALSYRPGLGEESLPNDISPTKDLDAMVAKTDGRPILLYALSFPSEPALGASPASQEQRFEALFAALGSRRAHFPFVNVAGLHDLGDEACQAYASDQQLGLDHPEVRFVCSTGLRDAAGAPKPAWDAFLAAAAGFAQP